MDYSQEDLLHLMGIVKNLAKKYTGNDSSSITYNTAQMLMEAVQYTISINLMSNHADINLYKGTLEYEKLYSMGKEKLNELFRDALEDYQRLLEDFDDFGISNYRHTVVDGLSAFFLHYDFHYRPQDHLLTLDYPIINDDIHQSGILRIKHYLRGIILENKILKLYPREDIIQRITNSTPMGHPYFMDNICSPVLLNMLSSLLIEKPIDTLQMTLKDIDQLNLYLSTCTYDELIHTLDMHLKKLLKVLDIMESFDYFKPVTGDYGARLMHSYNQSNSSIDIFFPTHFS